MLKNAFLFLIFFCSHAISQAYAEETISINGLSFPCKDCIVTRDYGCNLILDNGSKSLACDDALEYFYTLASNKKNTLSTHPSAEGLSKVIKDKNIPLKTKEIALRYFLITENHLQTIAESPEQLLEDNFELFTKTIPFNAENYKYWQIFWKAPHTSNKEVDLKTKAIIFTNYPQISLAEFIDEHLYTFFLELPQEVNNIIGPIREKREQDAKHLSSILNFVANCKKELESCLVLKKSELNQTEEIILSRIFIDLVSKKLKDRESSSEEALRFIESFDYQNINTPSLQKLISEILEANKGNCTFISQHILTFDFFKKRNSYIQSQLEDTCISEQGTNFNRRFLLILVFLLGIIIYNCRKLYQKNYQPNLLQTHQLELSRLIAYFNLEDSCDPHLIEERYRELAKTFHPDSSEGSSKEQFLELTRNYQRLKELQQIISRLKR